MSGDWYFSLIGPLAMGTYNNYSLPESITNCTEASLASLSELMEVAILLLRS